MKGPRSTRLGPRKLRGSPDETLSRLTMAAAREFNERGYFATDSNRIAKAGGYAAGTFYKHFVDKRAAFLAAYAWWVKTVWAAAEAESAPPQDPVQTVRAVVEVHRAWRGFRRDLKHLAATDDEVKRFYFARRLEQLDALVSRSGGANTPTHRAEAAALLLSIERTADAVAEGEIAALSVSESALIAELAARLEHFLHSTAEKTPETRPRRPRH